MQNSQLNLPSAEAFRAYRERYAGMRDYIGADTQQQQKRQPGGEIKLEEGQDIDWDEQERAVQDYLESEPVQSEQLLRDSLQQEEAALRDIDYLLKCGQNVVVHGVGSKRKMLQQIAENWRTHVPVLEVQGYLPSLQFKSVVQNITLLISTLLGEQVGTRRTETQLAYIEEKLQKEFGTGEEEQSLDIVALLVVHNIDGRAMRAHESVQQLSRILTHTNVCCVASIDSFRSGFALPRFCFVCVHSARSYHIEAKAMLANKQTRRDNEEGLRYIMLSLTDAQRQLVRTLAKHTLQAMQNEPQKSKAQIVKGNKQKPPVNSSAVTLSELWEMCLEESIFTTKSSLELSLLEIVDHRVFRIDDGRKYGMTHYSEKTLQRIVDNTLLQAEPKGDSKHKAHKTKINQENHAQVDAVEEQEEEEEEEEEVVYQESD